MNKTWYPAYIGLGSNLDEPSEQIRRALATLDELQSIKLVAVSSLYQTEPYGGVEQDDFVNAAAALVTNLNPEDLLKKLLEIETQQGRVRTQHWGPRRIDLDLLAYSNEKRNSKFLHLPHPEVHKRDFVLLPLAEIAPELMIVDLGRVKYLLADVEKNRITQLLKD